MYTHNQDKSLPSNDLRCQLKTREQKILLRFLYRGVYHARFDRCLRRPLGQSKPMNFVPDGVHRMFQLTHRGPREDLG